MSEYAIAASTAFAAGVAAADADNERRRAAVKLRRLIERAEKVRALLNKGWALEARLELDTAINEAKR